MKSDAETVLGIEAAIGGGSVSIHRGAVEIAHWIGESSVSRAEDLLPNIDSLLLRTEISPTEIDKVVVSIGPGSFTGVRIAIATVLGLRASLGVRCVGLSALHAMAYSYIAGKVLVAVPTGRNFICIQEFTDAAPSPNPTLIAEKDLVKSISEAHASIVVHHSLFQSFKKYENRGQANIIDAGMNMAAYLCSAKDSDFVSEELEPLFLERP